MLQLPPKLERLFPFLMGILFLLMILATVVIGLREKERGDERTFLSIVLAITIFGLLILGLSALCDLFGWP